MFGSLFPAHAARIRGKRKHSLKECRLIIFQGCGIRTFPIGGILDAPTQVTGSPTSTIAINNGVFVSKLLR
jgi:hypothetical protein